jgi:hypothetical protein
MVSEKDEKPKRKRHPENRSVIIKQRIWERLKRYVEEHRPRTSTAGVLETALERFLDEEELKVEE